MTIDLSTLCLNMLFTTSVFIRDSSLNIVDLATSVRLFTELIQQSKIEKFTRHELTKNLYIKLQKTLIKYQSQYNIDKTARDLTKVNTILRKYSELNLIGRLFRNRNVIRKLSKIF